MIKKKEKSRPLFSCGCYRGLEIEECATLIMLDV